MKKWQHLERKIKSPTDTQGLFAKRSKYSVDTSEFVSGTQIQCGVNTENTKYYPQHQNELRFYTFFLSPFVVSINH